jgi:hypothetical protein
VSGIAECHFSLPVVRLHPVLKSKYGKRVRYGGCTHVQSASSLWQAVRMQGADSPLCWSRLLTSIQAERDNNRVNFSSDSYKIPNARVKPYFLFDCVLYFLTKRLSILRRLVSFVSPHKLLDPVQSPASSCHFANLLKSSHARDM